MTEDINKKIRKKQITALVFSVLIMVVAFLFISNFTAIIGYNTAEHTPAKPDIFERIGNNFKENPKNFGWFVFGVGVFILASSIFNWNWIFKGHSYNLQKIEGISNMFGRGFARIYFGIGGIVCIVLGLVLILIS